MTSFGGWIAILGRSIPRKDSLAQGIVLYIMHLINIRLFNILYINNKYEVCRSSCFKETSRLHPVFAKREIQRDTEKYHKASIATSLLANTYLFSENCLCVMNFWYLVAIDFRLTTSNPSAKTCLQTRRLCYRALQGLG